MTAPSRTHLVIIPSYNTGAKVYETVRDARLQWAPVWVVVDGSDDGTAEGLQRMAAADPQLKVIELPVNSGKGSAMLAGLSAAQQAGFQHIKLNCVGTRSVPRRFSRLDLCVVLRDCSMLSCLILPPWCRSYAASLRNDAERCSLVLGCGQTDMFPDGCLNPFPFLFHQLRKSNGEDIALDP